MRHKMSWLAGTAVLTLFCIIGLQLFWLRTSYKDQEARFRTDAENTLISAQVRLSMSLVNADSSFNGRIIEAVLPDLLTELIKKAGTFQDHAGQKSMPDVRSMKMNVELPDSELTRYPELQRLVDSLGKEPAPHMLMVGKVGPDSVGVRPFTLAALKAEFENQLKLKGMAVGCEIAALDSQHRILYATNDTRAFQGMRARASVETRSLGLDDRAEYVQAAFPSVSWYLLKRMAWILAISAVLIVICVSSFFYLIALFFRQKRLSEVRNDFMNNMTHELKTPISSVSVALELISDAAARREEAPVQEYIQIAQGELNRLTMLVEKVLKMAAFEKSDIRIVPETFLAAPWINRITNSFKPIFETRGAVCTVELAPELLTLHGDKTHLTNVLQNLVDNAIKYNDKARPEIHISITAAEHSVVIRVGDNGKGIPEAYLKKIFDKFFRVPSGNIHDVKGYGLGLSYIRAVLDLHGGSIEVASTVHEGSTFTITLPNA